MDPIVLIPITVVFVVAIVLGRNELAKRKLTCPSKKKTADIIVLRRSWKPKQVVGIRRCSLLKDPGRVDCGQECLELCG